MSVWMTTPEAIAWIMFRDGGFALFCRDMKMNGLSIASVLRERGISEHFAKKTGCEISPPIPPVVTLDDATQFLIEGCQAGNLRARGRSGTMDGSAGGDLVPVTFGNAIDFYLSESRLGGEHAWRSRKVWNGTWWYDVVFSAEQVKSLFPAEPGKFSASEPAPTSVSSEIHSVTGLVEPSATQKRDTKALAAWNALQDLAAGSPHVLDENRGVLLDKVIAWCRERGRPVPGKRVMENAIRDIRKL